MRRAVPAHTPYTHNPAGEYTGCNNRNSSFMSHRRAITGHAEEPTRRAADRARPRRLRARGCRCGCALRDRILTVFTT